MTSSTKLNRQASLRIHQAMHLLLMTVLLVGVGSAQVLVPLDPQREHSEPDLRLWKLSVAALAGASALDVASSWGKCCERNSLLASPDGRFTTRGLAVKSGALASQLLVQYLVARRSPRLARVLTYVNFGGAALLTGVSIRNFGVPQPPHLARGSL